MKVIAKCPHCEKRLKVDEALMGKNVRCPACRHPFSLTSVASAEDNPNAASVEARETNGVRDTNLGSLGSAQQRQSHTGTTPGKIGRFELKTTLGKGSFGKVYRAYDPVLDREVALKVPHAGTLENKTAAQRFLREAKAAAQLRHPHIVPVYDAGGDEDEYYIASAFIEGQTLARFIDEERPDFRRAARIVLELAEGLDYAHGLGIVHRDVKPANVMVDEQGQPHVMDFGLARFEGSEEKLTQDGSIMGTPAYMSPEQAAGSNEVITAVTDQYSVGVVLYELLCGELPFSGPPQIVVFNVINQPPPAPHSLNPQIPKDLETICLKAMSKEPAGRYTDCQALADDLRRWLDDEPIHARRIGQVERFTRWCKRNPLVSGLAIAFVVALGVGIIVSSHYAVEANLQAQEARQKTAEAKDSELAAKYEQRIANQLRSTAEARELSVLRHLYTANVILAQQAHGDGNNTRALALLNTLKPEPEQPDVRGFEWYLLGQQARGAAASRILTGHNGAVTSVAFCDGAKSLVSSSDDGTCRLWDVGTGEQTVQSQADSGNAITSVVAAKDGKFFVTLSGSGHYSDYVEFHQLGLAEGTEHRDAIIKLQLPRLTVSYHAIALADDGSVLATGGSRLGIGSGFGSLLLWNVKTRQMTKELGHRGPRPHSKSKNPGGPQRRDVGNGGVTSIAFSPTDNIVASATDIGGISLWNTTTGGRLVDLEKSGYELKQSVMPGVNSIVFSPSGNLLAAGSLDGLIRLWNVQKREKIATLHGHKGTVNTVAFSPDERTLVSGGGKEDEQSELLLWNLATELDLLHLRGHESGVTSVAFSPDGETLASAGFDKTIRLWSRSQLPDAEVSDSPQPEQSPNGTENHSSVGE